MVLCVWEENEWEIYKLNLRSIYRVCNKIDSLVVFDMLVIIAIGIVWNKLWRRRLTNVFNGTTKQLNVLKNFGSELYRVCAFNCRVWFIVRLIELCCGCCWVVFLHLANGMRMADISHPPPKSIKSLFSITEC